MDLGQFQAQEREFCVTILYSFSCICRLSWACIFRETSTKVTRNANSSLTVFFHSLLLPTVLPLDCYLTPTGHFCSTLSTASLWVPLLTDLLSFLGPSSPRPFPVSREISSSSPLFQNRQRDHLPGAHTHIVSHVLIISFLLCTFTPFSFAVNF